MLELQIMIFPMASPEIKPPSPR